MHQKYTLTISDIEINVISDESPEAVEALVSIVDRKMREISSKSRNCSKAEAAILCSLDYCSDKIRAQRKIKALEAKIALTESTVDELIEENEALKTSLKKSPSCLHPQAQFCRLKPQSRAEPTLYT